MNLDRLLGFLDLLHRFQRIERNVLRRGEERRENDTEHSYQLAMLAWYLNDTDKLGMDAEKLVRYGLVHDLVEIYAGDTYAYTTDVAHRESKHAREAAAAVRLSGEFAEFPEFIEAIQTYERRDTREAKFVYALDKLLPMMNNYLDDGRGWIREGVTLEMIKSYKAGKVAVSPEVEGYYRELLAVIEQQPSLFPRRLDA